MNPLVILAIGIATVLGMILVLRVNAFLALITAAMAVGLLSGNVPMEQKIQEVATQLGGTAGKIGIVIALAAIIGKCLMDSGAADRIVRAFLKVLGENRGSTALLASAYTLSIPVFFDTVFYLLVPLAKAMRLRTGRGYVVYILAIAAGGAATHSLVPPTPGPLAAGEELGVDLGVVMLVGMVVAAVASVIPLVLYGTFASRKLDYPLRETPDISLDDLKELAQKPTDQLPPLWLSLAPIVLPVILITGNTVLDATKSLVARVPLAQTLQEALDQGQVPPALRAEAAAADEPVMIAANAAVVTDLKSGGLGRKWLVTDQDATYTILIPGSGKTINLYRAPYARATRIAKLLGNANLALLLAAAIAMWMLAHQNHLNMKQLATRMQPALLSAGLIILITAGGGAFGGMLKAAGVGAEIERIAQGFSVDGRIWLFVAFGVASMLKIAQGSGTVAIVVTAAMMAPILENVGYENLGYSPVYIVMAVGCGSKIVSWMNDSGFWVVCQMSGFTETETLKTWTVLLAIMGIVGFATTFLMATVLPLV